MSSDGDPINQARLAGAARGLTPEGLATVTWCGFALACCFVVLRLYVRTTESRRLFSDDYWLLAALFFLLTQAILQTLQNHSLYYLIYASAGEVPAGKALLDEGNIYVRYQFVIIVLFWTITWSVKYSFLALYYRLFDGLAIYRKIWWAVVILAAMAYVGCWIASVWTCHPPSTYFDFGTPHTFSNKISYVRLTDSRAMRKAYRPRRQRHIDQLQHSRGRIDRSDDHGTTDQASKLLARLPSSTTGSHWHIQRRVHRHCLCPRTPHSDHSSRALRSSWPGCLGRRGKQHERGSRQPTRSEEFLWQGLGSNSEEILGSARLIQCPLE
jgi:hypothetical protein